CIRCCEDFFRIEPFCFGIKRPNTTKNSCCGFSVKLLVSNGFRQRVKWTEGNRRCDVVTARPRDQLNHPRTGGAEKLVGALVIHRRSVNKVTDAECRMPN